MLDKAPHVAPEQPLPESDQVTPLFAGSFITVAVKLCVWPVVTLAEPGETATATAASCITVILAEENFVGSATEVAVRTTTAGDGTAPGAAYVTLVGLTFISVPQVAPAQPVPESAHVTPRPVESPATDAVKSCVRPTVTLAAAGMVATVIMTCEVSGFRIGSMAHPCNIAATSTNRDAIPNSIVRRQEHMSATPGTGIELLAGGLTSTVISVQSNSGRSGLVRGVGPRYFDFSRQE